MRYIGVDKMSKRIIEYFKDIRKVLELAEKPEGDEFKHIFRLILLGFVAIGALSFGIALLITTLFNVFGVGLSP